MNGFESDSLNCLEPLLIKLWSILRKWSRWRVRDTSILLISNKTYISTEYLNQPGLYKIIVHWASHRFTKERFYDKDGGCENHLLSDFSLLVYSSRPGQKRSNAAAEDYDRRTEMIASKRPRIVPILQPAEEHCRKLSNRKPNVIPT